MSNSLETIRQLLVNTNQEKSLIEYGLHQDHAHIFDDYKWEGGMMEAQCAHDAWNRAVTESYHAEFKRYLQLKPLPPVSRVAGQNDDLQYENENYHILFTINPKPIHPDIGHELIHLLRNIKIKQIAKIVFTVEFRKTDATDTMPGFHIHGIATKCNTFAPSSFQDRLWNRKLIRQICHNKKHIDVSNIRNRDYQRTYDYITKAKQPDKAKDYKRLRQKYNYQSEYTSRKMHKLEPT